MVVDAVTKNRLIYGNRTDRISKLNQHPLQLLVWSTHLGAESSKFLCFSVHFQENKNKHIFTVTLEALVLIWGTICLIDSH